MKPRVIITSIFTSGFGVDSISNFCTGNSALADTANPLSITCPTGFFPNVRALEPTSSIDGPIRRPATDPARSEIHFLTQALLRLMPARVYKREPAFSFTNI